MLAQDQKSDNMAAETHSRKITTDRTNSYLPSMHNSSEVPHLLAGKSEFISIKCTHMGGLKKSFPHPPSQIEMPDLNC